MLIAALTRLDLVYRVSFSVKVVLQALAEGRELVGILDDAHVAARVKTGQEVRPVGGVLLVSIVVTIPTTFDNWDARHARLGTLILSDIEYTADAWVC